MPTLYLRCDNKPVSQFELTEGVTRIGRGLDNELRVDDLAVSGHHARLHLHCDELFKNQFHALLEDCGSTNGTLVNGKPITRQNLAHGDIVRIGHHEMIYHDEQVSALGETAIYVPGEQS